jgi:SAM-dependent methyltransferase
MNKCPLCDSTNHELVFNNSRGNKRLDNYICDSCGFVYTYPRLSNEEIDKLYINGGFSVEARKAPEPDLSKFIQTETWALERVHFLEKKLPDFFLTAHRCLEIGCGTGSFLWLLKSRNQIAKGIEPDSTFVNVAKRRYGIDVESLLFDDFSSTVKYDLVCNFHVIEHVLDPRTFVKNMYRVLEDEGVIYIECPSIDNIYTNDLNTFFWDVHVNTFSNINLPWLLESEGFHILDVSMNRGFVSVIAKKGNNNKFDKDNKNRIIEIIKKHPTYKNTDTKSSKDTILEKIKRKLF